MDPGCSIIQHVLHYSLQCCVSHQVLLQFGHHLLQDAVVVLLETHQLREARDEKP